MKLVLGGINGEYLRNITETGTTSTEEVLAAVAYATDASLLIDWCWKNSIPLTYYGRLCADVAVGVPILSKFLDRRSPDFVCRLVEHHHAKVIWWRGIGVYIGSANFTHDAWYSNVEAGCFFDETEIQESMAADLFAMFDLLERHHTPLTAEVLAAMKERAAAVARTTPDASSFWSNPSFNRWSGVVQVAKASAAERRRDDFLREWHETLQILRDIAARISTPANRPAWVDASAPGGTQADQFLHAHYYQNTFDGTKAMYRSHYERNRTRRGEALADAIGWWGRLAEAPASEGKMLNETAPALRELLLPEGLATMGRRDMQTLCMGVHSIKDHARRVANSSVGLDQRERPYTVEEKVIALSGRYWNEGNSNGGKIKSLLSFVLHGGTNENLPLRLWEGVTNPQWKVPGIGISALGEIVGWGLPDNFPPRNGRTSKALRSLGYDVAVHVE